MNMTPSKARRRAAPQTGEVEQESVPVVESATTNQDYFRERLEADRSIKEAMRQAGINWVPSESADQKQEHSRITRALFDRPGSRFKLTLLLLVSLALGYRGYKAASPHVASWYAERQHQAAIHEQQELEAKAAAEARQKLAEERQARKAAEAEQQRLTAEKAEAERRVAQLEAQKSTSADTPQRSKAPVTHDKQTQTAKSQTEGEGVQQEPAEQSEPAPIDALADFAGIARSLGLVGFLVGVVLVFIVDPDSPARALGRLLMFGGGAAAASSMLMTLMK